MKDLLSHNNTKNDLTEYLSVKLMKSATFESKNLIVSWHNTCFSNKKGHLEHLASTQEEADTKLILHSLAAAKEHSTSRESLTITVCSPDSDVFFLLLKYYDDFSCHITFQTGSGSKRRDITVSSVASVLSKVQREALLAMHALSGCDTTGGFSKKGNHASAKLCLPKFITRFLFQESCLSGKHLKIHRKKSFNLLRYLDMQKQT